MAVNCKRGAVHLKKLMNRGKNRTFLRENTQFTKFSYLLVEEKKRMLENSPEEGERLQIILGLGQQYVTFTPCRS